ncbi:MAG: methionine adenosyltransferase [Clostridia bacterium]
MSKTLFSSESVTDGHPDKICDYVADSILDAILENDKYARVACECIATTGMMFIMGEITTKQYVDIPGIARRAVLEIGYDKPEYGFDGNTLTVITAINGQSPDIALGVDMSLEAKMGNTGDNFNTGAGDQGMMFGYACDETKEFMPLPISLAHALTGRLSALRKSGAIKHLRPDGKAQVTVEYDNGIPVRLDTIIVSTQHDECVDMETLKREVYEQVILTAVPNELIDAKTRILINPTGRFVIGGPKGDSGLTGRKLIVDTYGGTAHHGGGAFSGKDPTKVDRSAAYATRHVAKNIVAAHLASRCEIQLAYAIGVAEPVSISVDTFGTGIIPDEEIANIVDEIFDLRPAAIIERLGLRAPIYKQLSAFGHYGRNDLDLPWERLDYVDRLKAKVK